ncbi:phenylalanine--tRNA ligase subunit beta [bacterium]|nr:phenylalanine--tRNA ligase subunit beta [bacterium]
MQVSLSWLREFVKFDLSAQEVAEILSDLGLESEACSADIIDVEISPNRGDCLSILGIARELSAKLNLKLKLPSPQVKEKRDTPEVVKFSSSVKKFIPRYTYRLIKGVKIAPSPKEIQQKLASYGFRPINNVVDITNLVMIELGGPLHAFDLDKLKGKLKIRLAKTGDSLITLDGKERKLKDGDLIAEDGEGKLTDLCGIMGGFYSEVEEGTKTILLQSAIFDPVKIRLTSKRLRHQTDASYRYERGVDYKITKLALDRATELILRCAGGEATECIDLKFQELEERVIELDPAKVNQLLGTDFPPEKIKRNLERLFFVVKEEKGKMKVKVPSFRLFDIKFWQDLAEEVLRLESYRRLPVESLPSAPKPKNIAYWQKETLKDWLAKEGFSETLSYSFISRKEAKLFGLKEEELLRIKNPLSEENEFFRPLLLINVLKQVALNPYFPEVKMFEIGKVADKKKEQEHLIVLVAGKKKQGELRKVLPLVGAEVSEIKEVPPSILSALKIRRPVWYWEGELPKPRKIARCVLSLKKVKEPSSFPPAQIDLAFVVDRSLNPREIEEFLQSQSQVILAECFDEYVSDKFGPDKKSLAFHLWLQHPKRALTDKEVQEIISRLVKKMQNRYGAKLRR